MFTGLIQELGTVAAMSRQKKAKSAAVARITIKATGIASRLSTGDSVAVSGVCLTALEIGKSRFSADLARETLERTSLGTLKEGSVINLELPTKAGQPLGGHVVQGHVDGTGKLLSLDKVQSREDWRLKIEIPLSLAKYIVPQGSIAVEGISLTVAAIKNNCVEIAIIPHTYKATNLSALRAGDVVNIETDVLAKYAEKRTSVTTTSKLSVPALIRLGF